MANLIKLHSHENSISVISLERHGIYRKIAHSHCGKTLLNNELSGLKWYQKQLRLYTNDTKTNLYKLNGNILDIPIIKGQQVSYEVPLERTIGYILRALDHYALVWPPGDKGVVHGDLTMDNIFFSEQEVHFFDWEHFNEDGEIWGFDAVYLVLSSIVLNGFKKNVTRKELDLIVKAWEKLAEIGVKLDFLAQPISVINNILTTNSKWSLIISNSPLKLFPLRLTASQVTSLDQLFKQITSKMS